MALAVATRGTPGTEREVSFAEAFRVRAFDFESAQRIPRFLEASTSFRPFDFPIELVRRRRSSFPIFIVMVRRALICLSVPKRKHRRSDREFIPERWQSGRMRRFAKSV